MGDSLPEARRELADFLRTRRARLSPEQVGFPTGSRRRTPGLRREEVAQLAAISPSLYTWLEQGRAIRVSPQVLESLAQALRLDRSEREHLFLLTGQPVPPARPEPVEALSPALQRILDQQGIAPAHITGRRWDILAWNRAAAVVLEDFGVVSALDRNTIWRIFTNPAVRRVVVDWEDTARGLLAYFRMSYSRNMGDPSFTELIDALMQASAEFRAWWPEHDVLGTPDGRKVLNHPVAGRLVFDLTTFQVYDTSDLKLCIYVPVAESGTIEKLRQMLANKKVRRPK
ncbi:MAG TPA: helix-turn-helix transcriptional regulator [Candidatus Acidoferrales bacterium]|nr:helix-turn-helix transcriptional regulator [Candidatus Acidoferrales bacterium]